MSTTASPIVDGGVGASARATVPIHMALIKASANTKYCHTERLFIIKSVIYLSF